MSNVVPHSFSAMLPGHSIFKCSLVAVIAVLWIAMPVAAEQRFSSGTAQVSLLELYTSEGCSSCPPADRWLSRLQQRPDLWSGFVPIAFHVDYWDYIGWKDRFSQARFGDRQRRYARENNNAVVYTPGIMLNGKEWRQWRQAPATIPAGRNKPGDLSVVHRDGAVEVLFAPAVENANLVATVAWLAFDRKSEVTAGENKGRQLENDFVVIEIVSAPLPAAGKQYRAVIERPDSLELTGRTGIAAWVAQSDSLAPLQATGGWLDGEASNTHTATAIDHSAY